ncbi:DUF4388 domain-containing protein [Nitrospira defluvii]|nr:DUF4388 domain-containing protein [Nitrospira defluvii]
MALKGHLRDFSPFDILELIHIKRKTGILFVTSSDDGAEETITLGFVDGALVLAESTAKRLEVQLGKVLVKSGRLSKEALEEGLAIQEESLERLGLILCREKFCSEQDISEAIHVQIKRIVFTLLRWEIGTFVFELQDSLEHFHEFVTPIVINRILMEGAVIMDEWPRIKKVIHSLDIVFHRLPVLKKIVISTEPETFEFEGESEGTHRKGTQNESIKLNEEEGALYHLIDGKMSIRDVLDQTIHSEFAGCKVFFELIQKRLIEEVSETLSSESQRKNEEGAHPVASKTPEGNPPLEMEPIRWGIARALFHGALPSAIVLGITISDEKAILLQGKTNPALWPDIILPILKEVTTLNKGTPIGAYEYITDTTEVAFFWNLKSDYILVVATTLTGKTVTSRFRAQVATVVRSFIHRA